MRRITLAIVVMTACVSVATSTPDCSLTFSEDCRLGFTESNLRTPVAPDKASVGYLDLINALESARVTAGEERRLRSALADLQRQRRELRPSLSNAFGLWGLEDQRHEYDVQISRVDRQLATVTSAKYASMNRAITLTIDLYNLTPRITVAPEYPDPRINPTTPLPWRPHYSENQTFDEHGHGRLLTPTERARIAANFGGRGGAPNVDGGTDRTSANVVIFPSPFERALLEPTPRPGLLAATIYHETTHWLDAAARGRHPTPQESFRSEERAYLRQAGQAAIFGLRAAEVDELRQTAATYKSWADSIGNMSWQQLRVDRPDIMPVISFSPEIAAAADDAEAARAAAEREFNASPDRFNIPPFSPSPRPLPPPADPATVFRPFIPPSSYAAEEPASLRTGAMIDMAAAACRGAWEEARSLIPIYGRLTPQDCATLANRAASQPHGCQRGVVERVVSMNRNGESLGIERLQAEVAAFNPAPIYPDIPERERPDGTSRGGVRPGDRPAQRDAERRLRNGW